MSEQKQAVGRYQLLERIGRGAMGTVYHALDAETGLHVALKLMAPELSGDAELVERFRREAFSAADLDHGNVTAVYDFGQEGDQLYMAMELLEGADLKDLVEQNRLGDLAWRIGIMEQVAAGMAFVHSRNLVHRDLKPANIHVTPEGCVKIMDFGLVRVSDSNMTATGMVMGSPSYMSPEQLKGEKCDARSDVFSLGAVYYELLTGQRAFVGKGVTQIMMNVVTNNRKPLVEVAPEAPLPLVHVVERCLRPAPDARYQTAGELHAAVEVVQAVYTP